MEDIFGGIIRGMTSHYVRKKLEKTEKKEKTTQRPHKQKDGRKKK